MTNVPEEFVKERRFLKRRINALLNEYEAKVAYKFSHYIYIGVDQNCNISMEEAIDLVVSCAGYEAHRIVRYKHQYVTNLCVRFETEGCAEAAFAHLRQQKGYCVEKVQAILRAWYLEEMLKGNFPWTLALVSIVGRAEHTNPLSRDILQSMLEQFGDPRIHTYHNENHVEHVQVLFSSMSEALGASLVHGRWYKGSVEVSPRFFYNIQIMGSQKEATLFRSVQKNKVGDGEELEAFEMDYFVQKMETRMYSYADETRQIAPTSSQESRSSPRYKRQYSRSRGNGGRGRGVQFQYDNRNSSRKYRNCISPIIPFQFQFENSSRTFQYPEAS